MSNGQKKIPMAISIKYMSGGRAPHRSVGIELKDLVSGITFADITLTSAAFGEALGHVGDVRGEGAVRGLDRIGLKSEHKTEQIDISRLPHTYGADFGARLAKLVKPYEIDGWIASVDETHNRHREEKGRYTVHFTRYVPATPEQIEEIYKRGRETYEPYRQRLIDLRAKLNDIGTPGKKQPHPSELIAMIDDVIGFDEDDEDGS